jgi:hypothetical protein
MDEEPVPVDEAEGEPPRISEMFQEETPDDILSLDRFPDQTDVVLEAMTYGAEGYGVRAREQLTRSDIVDLLPPDVDLNKDQVKYRVEKMADCEKPLCGVTWKDHPESRTPTAYYQAWERGEYVATINRTAHELFGEDIDPDDLDRDDLFVLVDELEQTRAQVAHLRDRIDELAEDFEELQEPEEDGFHTGS